MQSAPERCFQVRSARIDFANHCIRFARFSLQETGERTPYIIYENRIIRIVSAAVCLKPAQGHLEAVLTETAFSRPHLRICSESLFC